MNSARPNAEPLLKVAVPNKGALAERRRRCCTRPGYAQRSDPKELVLFDEANGVEFFYLRPRDIAVYVGEGTLDVGITGRDMLLDSGAPATEVMPLGFGRSRFRFAAPGGQRDDRGRAAGSAAGDLLSGPGRGLPEGARRGHPADFAGRRSGDRDPARAWPTRSPTWWRPAPRCGRPAWSCSATRSWSPRRS